MSEHGVESVLHVLRVLVVGRDSVPDEPERRGHRFHHVDARACWRTRDESVRRVQPCGSCSHDTHAQPRSEGRDGHKKKSRKGEWGEDFKAPLLAAANPNPNPPRLPLIQILQYLSVKKIRFFCIVTSFSWVYFR